MDFDHLPGSQKDINIAMVVRAGWSKERIDREIAKCDLVCACCHRVRSRIRIRGGVSEEATGLQNQSAEFDPRPPCQV